MDCYDLVYNCMETRDLYGDVWISMIFYGFVWILVGSIF